MTQTTGQATDYERARARLLRKRKFSADLMAYFLVNAILVGIWAFNGQGYFWPGWVLAGWGVLLVLDGWDVYFRSEVTEQDIQKEMRRLQGPGASGPQ